MEKQFYNIHFYSKTKMRTLVLLLIATLALAQQCNKGGIPSSQNQCLYPSYIEGCLNYACDNACQECEYNYKLINGACYYSPNSSQQCCLSFDSQSQCTSCAGGLQPNPSSGVCQDIKIPGCIQKAANGCQICSKDYDFVNGKCAPSVSKCIKYDANLNCVGCDGSSVLKSGVCTPVITVKDIPNCKVITEYGCGQCQSGFRIDSKGNCQPSLSGCLVHNNDGSCKQCEAPFFQLTKGKCAIVGCTQYCSNGCQKCDSSLGFVLTNNRCEIPNCIYFSKNGCSACSNGLVAGSWGCRQPEGKVCLICKLDQFLGADGQCHKKNVHCVNYQNGVCTKCCDSFFLDLTNDCKPILPGCIYKNKQCASCYSPFTFVNGQCVIDGCVKYSKKGCQICDQRLKLFGDICGLPHCKQIYNFQCKICVSGYQLNSNNECVKVDPNCLKKNQWNRCLKCNKGYRLDQNGICSSQKWGCNYVDGRCTSCRAPFVYIPQSQSCEIDGCLEYFVGGCKSCDQGYALLYNTCKLPNCLISNKGKCVECDPDYVFKSDGTCVSKDEFCEKMDEYGTCIKCMDSYYYSQKDQKCIKKEPGCEYNQQGICSSCYYPFVFKNGRCSIKGCMRFDQTGCYQCKYPFSLSSDKTCVISHCTKYGQDGRCSGCEQGYALNQQSLCQSSDQYCQEYNQDRTACIACVKGYRVDQRGRCQYADEHCSYFDESGLCINCDRLYFLNFYGKCQLRDPQCSVYTNGLCAICRSYYFPKQGICMPNMAGCKVQKSYGNCQTCEKGYQKKGRSCVAKITKLSWNSIDMDFFDDEDECSKEASKEVFSVGVGSKLNLVPVMSKGNGKVFYSSSSLNRASFTFGSKGTNGWSPKGKCPGQYVGYQTSNLETFYAVDIQQLRGSSLSSFSIQYSMDGKQFIKVQDFSFQTVSVNSITTFYFKAVYARAIRIVVNSGTPNIRFQFYVSSPEKQSTQVSTDTYIGERVVSTVDGVEEGGLSTCDPNGLCWAGVESCEPRQIRGFSLIYKDCPDRVTEVKVEYSADGLNFVCYNNCEPLPLTNNGYIFPSPVLAEKMHIHFTKYEGKPSFGIKFEYN